MPCSSKKGTWCLDALAKDLSGGITVITIFFGDNLPQTQITNPTFLLSKGSKDWVPG